MEKTNGGVFQEQENLTAMKPSTTSDETERRRSSTSEAKHQSDIKNKSSKSLARFCVSWVQRSSFPLEDPQSTTSKSSGFVHYDVQSRKNRKCEIRSKRRSVKKRYCLRSIKSKLNPILDLDCRLRYQEDPKTDFGYSWPAPASWNQISRVRTSLLEKSEDPQ